MVRRVVFLNHDEGCDLGVDWLNRDSESQFKGYDSKFGLEFPNHDLQFRNVVKVSFTSSHRRRQLYLQKVQ